MVIAEEKVELRKYFKRLRSQLTAEQAASGSLLTARQILACDAYRKANCIMGYLAFGNELSVDLVLQQALADGKTVAVPLVQSATEMAPVQLENMLEFELDRYGIRSVRQPAKLLSSRKRCSFLRMTLYWCPEWPSAATAADWGWARVIMTVFCRRRKTHCSWASLTMLLFSRICRGMNLTCLYSF